MNDFFPIFSDFIFSGCLKILIFMMNTKSNSILTVFYRFMNLLIWLGKVGIKLRQLDNNNLAARQQTLQEMGQNLLKALHIRMQHDAIPQHEKGALIVANHITWLDIFVLNALYPSGFIAAKELRNWFVVGKMIENAGTVFIDRSSRKDIEPINRAMSERLQNHENVCFFPEAKTSLGNNVLPMKAALFQAAIDTQAPIQAVALRYYVNGVRTERVSFSGTHFLITLWRILTIPELVVRADFGDAIETSRQPESDRFALKDQAETFIKKMVLSDSPNPERLLLNESERTR